MPGKSSILLPKPPANNFTPAKNSNPLGVGASLNFLDKGAAQKAIDDSFGIGANDKTFTIKGISDAAQKNTVIGINGQVVDLQKQATNSFLTGLNNIVPFQRKDPLAKRIQNEQQGTILVGQQSASGTRQEQIANDTQADIVTGNLSEKQINNFAGLVAKQTILENRDVDVANTGEVTALGVNSEAQTKLQENILNTIVGKSDKVESKTPKLITIDQKENLPEVSTMAATETAVQNVNHVTTEQIAKSLIFKRPFVGNKPASINSNLNFEIPQNDGTYEFYVEVKKENTEVYNYLLRYIDKINAKKWFGFYFQSPTTGEYREPSQVTLNYKVPDTRFSEAKSLFFYFRVNVGVVDNSSKDLIFVDYPAIFSAPNSPDAQPFKLRSIKVIPDPAKVEKKSAGDSQSQDSKAVAYEGSLSETDPTGKKQEAAKIADDIKSGKKVESNDSQGKAIAVGQSEDGAAIPVGQSADQVINVGGEHSADIRSSNTGNIPHEFHAYGADSISRGTGSVGTAIGAVAIAGALGGKLTPASASFRKSFSPKNFKSRGAAAVGSSGQDIRSATGGQIDTYTSQGFQNNIVPFNRGSGDENQTFLDGSGGIDQDSGVLLKTFEPWNDDQSVDFGEFSDPLAGLGENSLSGGFSVKRKPKKNQFTSADDLAKRQYIENSNKINRDKIDAQGGARGDSVGGNGLGGGGKVPPGGRKSIAASPDDFPEKTPEERADDFIDYANLIGDPEGLRGEIENENQEEYHGDDFANVDEDKNLPNLSKRSGKSTGIGTMGSRLGGTPTQRSTGLGGLSERVKGAKINDFRKNIVSQFRKDVGDRNKEFKNNLLKKGIKTFGKQAIRKFLKRGFIIILLNPITWIILAALLLTMIFVGGIVAAECRPEGELKNFRDSVVEPAVWVAQLSLDPLNVGQTATLVAGAGVNTLANVGNFIAGKPIEGTLPPSEVRKAIEALPGCSDLSKNCDNGGGVGNALAGSTGVYDCKSQKITTGGTGARPPAAISDDASVSKAIFYYLTFINAGETEGASGPEATSKACISKINPGGDCWGMYQLPKAEVLGGAGNLDACKLYVEIFKADLQGCRDNYLKDPAIQAKVQMARLYKRTGSTISTMSNYYGTNVVEYAKSIGLDYKSGQLPIEHLKEAQKAIDAKDFEKAKKIFRLVDYYDQAFGDRNQCSGDLCRYVKREKPVIDYAFSTDLYEKVKAGCSGGSVSNSSVNSSSSKVGYLDTRQQDQTNKYWSEAFGFPVLAKVGEQIKRPVLTGLEVLDDRILAFNKVMEGKVSVEASKENPTSSATGGTALGNSTIPAEKIAQLKKFESENKITYALNFSKASDQATKGSLNIATVDFILALANSSEFKAIEYTAINSGNHEGVGHGNGVAIDIDALNLSDGTKVGIQDAFNSPVESPKYKAVIALGVLMDKIGIRKALTDNKFLANLPKNGKFEHYPNHYHHYHVEMNQDGAVSAGSSSGSDGCPCPASSGVNLQSNINGASYTNANIVNKDADQKYMADAKSQTLWPKLSNPVIAIIHYTASKSRTFDAVATDFKNAIAKGPGNSGNQGWAHYMIDKGGEMAQFMPEDYKVSGSDGQTGAYFKDNQKLIVNDHSLQYEVHYDPTYNSQVITDKQLESLAKTIVKSGLKADQIYTHWAVQPFDRSDSTDWLRPDGNVTPELVKFIKYAGWATDEDGATKIGKQILKQNIENAIKVHEDPELSKKRGSNGGEVKLNTLKAGLPKVSNVNLIFNIFGGLTAQAASKRPSSYADITPEHQAFMAKIAEKRGYFKTTVIGASELTDIGSGKRMEKSAAAAFKKMQTKASGEGVTLTPVSGFRDLDDQVDTYFTASGVTKPIQTSAIFENGKGDESAYNGRLDASAVPGYSEHHTGKVVDLNSLETSFDQSAAYKWLDKNAKTFGFELSYPKNSTSGANYEPWHWRFGPSQGGSTSSTTGSTAGQSSDCKCPQAGDGTGSASAANISKQFLASKTGQDKWESNDPKYAIIHYTAYGSKIEGKESARRFKSFVEGGPGNSGDNGWAHYLIDVDGTSFSIVDENKTVSGTKDSQSAIYENGKKLSTSVDKNSIQYEIHYDPELKQKISDAQIKAVAGLVVKSGLKPENIMTHWGVQPSTRRDSSDWIKPTGEVTPELISFVKYAGWATDDTKATEVAKLILKNNIENAIKVWEDSSVGKGGSEVPLSTLKSGLTKVSSVNLIFNIFSTIKAEAATDTEKEILAKKIDEVKTSTLSNEEKAFLDVIANQEEGIYANLKPVGSDNNKGKYQIGEGDRADANTALKAAGYTYTQKPDDWTPENQDYLAIGRTLRNAQIKGDKRKLSEILKDVDGFNKALGFASMEFQALPEVPGYTHSGNIGQPNKNFTIEVAKKFYVQRLALYGGASSGSTDNLGAKKDCPTAIGGTEGISTNADATNLGVTKSKVADIESKGGPFTPAVRAFLDTIASRESSITYSGYNSGNFGPGDFDASGSTDLHPVLKSKGINKTTVKNCTTPVAIDPPFNRSCFPCPDDASAKCESALNIGRYQYYGDHTTLADEPGQKSALGYINTSPKYFTEDVKKANEGLAKAGIDFVIKDFKPGSQDFYPLGKFAYIASKAGKTEVNLTKLLGDGSKENFLKAVESAKSEWASAPGAVQQLASIDEYYKTYQIRLAIYEKDK
jgi:zinc D-Ala-D-Ala carboxypeptidase